MNKKSKKHYFTFMNVARASLFVMLVFLITGTSLFTAQAADLQQRQIILGTSEPSASTTHSFSFINPSASTLGSIKFEYCTSPLFSVTCVAPAGLDVLGASLSVQTGNVGFSKSLLTTVSEFILTRPAAGTLSTTNTYQLSGVINPSSVSTTAYVRISLYSSTDTTGIAFDRGATAFSTSGSFGTTVFVPPFLTFCVGVTVASDCSSTSGSLVNFGELTSSVTRTVTTQFAAATNSPTGLQVFLNGQTMTSGNNTIPQLPTATSSSTGTSQFGLNLVANSQPSLGASRSGIGTTVAVNGYGNTNQFKFNNGDVIARSTVSTNYNVFTVSYIANVSEDQAPGVYATTLLYTALVTF
jgi:hypothetical protein